MLGIIQKLRGQEKVGRDKWQRVDSIQNVNGVGVKSGEDLVHVVVECPLIYVCIIWFNVLKLAMWKT